MVTLFEAITLVKATLNGQKKDHRIARLFIEDQLVPLWGIEGQLWPLEDGLEIL